MDRSDPHQSAKALVQCARYLRHRCSVGVFPEDTRSPDGRVLPFNDGALRLAIREQVPLLPVVLEGAGSALPKNSCLFQGTQDIHLRILPAVPVEGWNTSQSSVLREIVRQRMIEELDRLRGGDHSPGDYQATSEIAIPDGVSVAAADADL